jgi:AcrR family transcriptional regulator
MIEPERCFVAAARYGVVHHRPAPVPGRLPLNPSRDEYSLLYLRHATNSLHRRAQEFPAAGRSPVRNCAFRGKDGMTEKKAGQRNRKRAAAGRPQAARSGQRNPRGDSRTEIIEAARKLLAHGGIRNFTLRGVAQAAGLHLRSVQYYFPGKDELLNAVLSHTLEHYYFDKYTQLADRAGASTPRERLLVMLDYLLADLRDPFTTHFFFELWALASRDPVASRAMDDFYARHRESFAVLIRALNPSLDEDVVVKRATLVAMLIEGLLLMVGAGKPAHPEFRDIDEEAKRRILDMVMAP